MVDCRLCVNWFDHFTEPDPAAEQPTDNPFCGCRLFGLVEDFREMSDCPRFEERTEPYVLCPGCSAIVPRVCVLLGECVNCLDTDLFCQEQCSGGSWQKYCTHWVRLSSEGRAKVGEDQSVTVDLAAEVATERRKPRNLKEVYLNYLRRKKGRP